MLKIVQTNKKGEEEVFEIIDENNKLTKKGALFLILSCIQEIIADIAVIMAVTSIVRKIKKIKKF